MTRRLLLGTLGAAAQLRGQDPPLADLAWQEYAKVWNAFAEKINAGIFDVKLWNQVRRKFHAIEGKTCSE